MRLSEELFASLRSRGANIVGVADLQRTVPNVCSGFAFGISIGVALNPYIVDEIRDGPTKKYYNEYKRVNGFLGDLARYTEHFLQKRGHSSLRLAATSAGIDPETLSTRLPHKTVATRAGLGWIGKCALLVTRQFGSAIRLTTVLTDATLSVGTPINSSNCGKCTNCVDACPAHALSGEDWQVTKHRDLLLNAFSCQKAAYEQVEKRVFSGTNRSKIGMYQTICGICIAVCPFTQEYIKSCLNP